MSTNKAKTAASKGLRHRLNWQFVSCFISRLLFRSEFNRDRPPNESRIYLVPNSINKYDYVWLPEGRGFIPAAPLFPHQHHPGTRRATPPHLRRGAF